MIEAHHDDTCNDAGPATEDNDGYSRDVGDCTFEVTDVDWEVNAGEITAEFDLESAGECNETDIEIGLVSYEDDCEYESLVDMDLDDQ